VAWHAFGVRLAGAARGGDDDTAEPDRRVVFSRHRALVREVASRAERADIDPGEVFVTGDDAISWSSVADITEALEIYPDPELLRRVVVEAGDRGPVTPALGVRDAVVFGIAFVLRRAHVAGGALTDMAASTLAHRLAGHLVEHYTEGGPLGPRPGPRTLDRRAVNRIAEFVDAELGNTLTLDRLAALASLSPFHFARSFRAATGLPPHRFVTARRLEAAKTRLMTSDASVVEVAHAVGFANVSHFRRIFRRDLGILPGELRALSGTGQSKNGASGQVRSGDMLGR